MQRFGWFMLGVLVTLASLIAAAWFTVRRTARPQPDAPATIATPESAPETQASIGQSGTEPADAPPVEAT